MTQAVNPSRGFNTQTWIWHSCFHANASGFRQTSLYCISCWPALGSCCSAFQLLCLIPRGQLQALNSGPWIPLPTWCDTKPIGTDQCLSCEHVQSHVQAMTRSQRQSLFWKMHGEYFLLAMDYCKTPNAIFLCQSLYWINQTIGSEQCFIISTVIIIFLILTYSLYSTISK